MLVVLSPAEQHFATTAYPYYSQREAPRYLQERPYSAYPFFGHIEAYEDFIRRRDQQEAHARLRRIREAEERARAREAAEAAIRRQEALQRIQAFYEHRQRLQQRQQQQAEAQARFEANARARYHAYQAEQQRRRAIAFAEEQRQSRLRQQREQEKAIAKNIFASIMAAVAEDSAHQVKASSISAKPVETTKSTSTTAPAAQPQPAAKSSTTLAERAEPSVTFFLRTDLKRHTSSHAHLRKLLEIRQQLEEHRSSFATPKSLAFDHEKSASNSPVLAYSADNKAFRAYEEHLTRLLVELDTVDTGGLQTVKTERKALAVAIEEELTRLDNIKAETWEKTQRGQATSGATEQPVNEEAVTVIAPAVVESVHEATEAVDTTKVAAAEAKGATVAHQPDVIAQCDKTPVPSDEVTAADTDYIINEPSSEGYSVETPTAVAGVIHSGDAKAVTDEKDPVGTVDGRSAEAAQNTIQGEQQSGKAETYAIASDAIVDFASSGSTGSQRAEASHEHSASAAGNGGPAVSVKTENKSAKVSDVDEDEDAEVSSESSFEMLDA